MLHFHVFLFLWGGDNCHVDVDNVQHHELVQFYGV